MQEAADELARIREGREATPSPLVRPEYGAREPFTHEEAERLVSMTFTSRTTNVQPHVVSVGYDAIPRCTCRANHTCWAVKAYCRVTGAPTP